MFLKSLTLKGFKSFADTTVLDLEPGITVVVGPNGSGKSNVVDAIGWVLGAQAPSVVRSKSMDDVIFAGTPERAPLGRAEVALTIDNSTGVLPLDFSEVTVTRTLFRTGDSEYAINGVACRLLDIQDLLSDAGVGRQQHVIVSQGQIDAVLNAKPEDRRAIVEEAAGVLKFRKRKEKAERRLTSTEGNLNRLQDLLREVRRQLRPLEKQADAARRHGSVVAELTTLRLHVAGREIARLRSRLDASARERADLDGRADALSEQLARLDTDVIAVEAELAAQGGGEVSDDLVAMESQRERARGLQALLRERRRGLERERESFVDQGVIFSLEADAAQLRTELAELEETFAGFEPEGEALRADEAALAVDRHKFDEEVAAVEGAAAGQAAERRGELAARRGGLERDRSELERVEARLADLGVAIDAKQAEADRLRREIDEMLAAEQPLMSALEEAEHERRRVDDEVVERDEALRRIDAEHNRWTARAEALEMALDEAHERAGADRLAGLDGFVGTLFDVVTVDDGWLPAFEAAAGSALGTVLVADADAATLALEHLHEGDGSGALLPLSAVAGGGAPPSVGEPVRAHVHADDPRVAGLLDELIGAAVAVADWREGVDAAIAHPRSVVVTRAGDRFGPSGWRVGTHEPGATRAALDEARNRAADARHQRQAAVDTLDQVRAAAERARGAEADRETELDEHDGRRTAALEVLGRVDADRSQTAAERDSLDAQRDELVARIAREQARVVELEADLPDLEAADEEAAATGRRMRETRGSIEARAAELGARRTDLEVRTAGAEERRQMVSSRLAGIEERLERDADQAADAEARRADLDRREAVLSRLATTVDEAATAADRVLAEMREQRRAQSEATRAVAQRLDGLRRERVEAEQGLREAREEIQRSELAGQEVRLKLDSAVEALRRDHDCEPERAVATPLPELDENTTPVARVRELERELRLMGPINPLALEEFEALQERHSFLQGQLDDVRESRRDLRKVIKAVDGEIEQVFAAAYADVSENFTQLFHTLFPGGQGGLKLTAPDDLLNTGIEVEARPSGKNVRKLSLLSGGERSLTAMAFLFAVFRSRPSPFYVLDEVEAALDDVNLHRFLDLLAEFREEAQLVVVSHQKRTMEAADILYGVTMERAGSSKVISERVADNETLVAV